jgi:hypothetical protein
LGIWGYKKSRIAPTVIKSPFLGSFAAIVCSLLGHHRFYFRTGTLPVFSVAK